MVEPQPHDVLSLSEEELNDVMKTKIIPGKWIEENANIFTSYYARVNTHQQIRQAYLKNEADEARGETFYLWI